MITEDHVSFETAKLLKEKGFECTTLHYYYDKDGDLLFSAWRVGAGKNEFVAPTLQMAMKWLREVHHIFIDIDRDARPEPEGFGNKPYFSLITNMNTNKFYRGKDLPGECASYEEACEAAIKYCLENLI